MENPGVTVHIQYLSIPFYSAHLFLQNSNLHSYQDKYITDFAFKNMV